MHWALPMQKKGGQVNPLYKKVMPKTRIMPQMQNSERNAVVYEVFIGIHLEWPK